MRKNARKWSQILHTIGENGVKPLHRLFLHSNEFSTCEFKVSNYMQNTQGQSKIITGDHLFFSVKKLLSFGCTDTVDSFCW